MSEARTPAQTVSDIVHRAGETIEEALDDRKKRRAMPPSDKPRVKPLTEVAALERSVALADLALNKYEVKLEDGDELTPEEERVFLAHQESCRKLQTTLAALRAKLDHGKKTDKELAISMLEADISVEQVREMYPAKGVQVAITEWEKKKEKRK